mmetsp:Transcript_75588/g.139271  ORF Transcript_75588/g.139271 Transcript_75588/m.139271 type:complete len:94 (+) Transcript_75588:1877-2158(+)
MLWNLGYLDDDLADMLHTAMCLWCWQRILPRMLCTYCCLLQTGIYHLGTSHRLPALAKVPSDPVHKKYTYEHHFGWQTYQKHMRSILLLPDSR